jgi:uncharacterized Ntn-hydrolase superfamily protein
MRQEPWVATFSIVGRDPAAEEWGVAVQSRFLAVGAVVPWAQAGVGALATQAWANIGFGPAGLALLREGLSATEVVDRLLATDERGDHRQLGVVDARGGSAAWTGSLCFPWAGHRSGVDYTCQGNILTGEDVVLAMEDAFLTFRGSLAQRLVAALQAGQRAGGDSRGQQSAAVLVVRERGGYGGHTDRAVELRVDDHPLPIDELERLLGLHQKFFASADAASLIRAAGNVVREMQEILTKQGYYHGPISGEYDAVTRAAYRRFCHAENFEERYREDEFVDREVLNFLRGRYGHA